MNIKEVTDKKGIYDECKLHLKNLCVDIQERPVGSEGNRRATCFFKEALASLGWETESSELDVMDWHDGGAELEAEGTKFEVYVGPYSKGCSVRAEIIGAASISDLEVLNCESKILLLHGEIAKEQLMPKNFVFYNPEEHKRIVKLLEESGAKAIVCATGRNPSLAGGVYPFPMIEDGDFDVPSVYMTDSEGHSLLKFIGKEVSLVSRSERIAGKGYNVIGRKGKRIRGRIVLVAHIDAKKGSPGAIDNATGVVALLALAKHLKNWEKDIQLELVAFNGEDYYAASGQMDYIAKNKEGFEDIILNITIDGAGYKKGGTYFSLYEMPARVKEVAKTVIEKFENIEEGPIYPQGDHSIFVQKGCPAIAVSSRWLIDNLTSQSITHTAEDKAEIVDCAKIVEIAEAIKEIVEKL